jgi:hypothetical protein
MSRSSWGLWFFCLALLNASPLPCLAAENITESKEGGLTVEDDREASFLPPPATLLKIDEVEQKEETPKDLTAPPPFKPEVKTSTKTTVPDNKERVETKAVDPEKQLPSAPIQEGALALSTPSASTPKVPEVVAPVKLADPVSKSVLSDIDPETLGLLSAENGGLGASLWKGTDREFLDRFLPAISIPSSSPTLNDLAKRLFLSTAAVPASSGKGEPKAGRSLLAQRLEALIALGAVREAWELALMADPKLIDRVTLRSLTEAALVGPESKEICDKVPSLIAAHAQTAGEASAEWQKSLLICQMRANDQKAVQLGVDLMREQNAKDAIFLSLMTKNYLGGADKLPRQLTPLRPTTLAVLRQLNKPLPPELYARADGSVVSELLLSQSRDEKARIQLAERAAAQGLISAKQLIQAYGSIAFKPEELAIANADQGVLGHALAAQALQNEKLPQKKIDIIQKIMSGSSLSALTGSLGHMIADYLDDVPVIADYNAFAVPMARYFALAGRPEKVLAWYNVAKAASANSPDLKVRFAEAWPLFVLSGIVPDGTYATGLKEWLDVALAPKSEQEDGTAVHARRERCGQILLLLGASGYAVGEDAWLRVVEPIVPTKQIVPSPILLDRLKQAGQSARKGETVLLSLLLLNGAPGEVPLEVHLAVVSAFRQVGLLAEAQALAREVLMRLEGV